MFQQVLIFFILKILLLSLNVFACVFPAQANDDMTVDKTQSFYVGGE